MRTIRLLGTFLRASFQEEAAHSGNFYLRLLSTLLGLAGSIGGMWILFSNSASVGGWDASSAAMVLGVYLLMQALRGFVFEPSLDRLSGMGGELWSGNFDYTLLKPVSTQFLVSFRMWSPWAALDIACGIGVIVYALLTAGARLSAADLGLFLIALAVALCILYSVMLLLSTVAFWYRGTFVLWVLNDILQTGRYPVGIYPDAVRVFLMWVVPVGFIVTVPAEALLGALAPATLALGGLLAVFLLLVSGLFFRYSLRRYEGASA